MKPPQPAVSFWRGNLNALLIERVKPLLATHDFTSFRSSSIKAGSRNKGKAESNHASLW
jgi:hypothetical protein